MACHYYKVAADAGIKDAMHNHATMLFNGDGVDVDIDEAINYYQMASESGDEESNEKLNKITNNDSDKSTAK